MTFAVNYSPPLAEMVQAGQVHIDRFKCPAWPDLIGQAAAVLPVYVHFPLEVGWGQGVPYHSERQQPADLDWLADLLESSGTPYINTHFMPPQAIYSHIPPHSSAPQHIREVLDAALRDLQPLIQRFGAQRVLIENCIGDYGMLRLSVLPEVLQRLIEESGCGFLFDQSHARLAARALGLNEREYANMLPMQHLREMHVTGLQRMAGDWLERLLANPDTAAFAERMRGQTLDHFPMSTGDWPELAWASDNIRAGRWAAPWVTSFEYGGVGGFFEAVTERAILLEQVPRMAALLTGAA